MTGFGTNEMQEKEGTANETGVAVSAAVPIEADAPRTTKYELLLLLRTFKDAKSKVDSLEELLEEAKEALKEAEEAASACAANLPGFQFGTGYAVSLSYEYFTLHIDKITEHWTSRYEVRLSAPTPQLPG